MPIKRAQKTIDEKTINDTDSEGYTDLMRAVENNDIKKIKKYLK